MASDESAVLYSFWKNNNRKIQNKSRKEKQMNPINHMEA